MTKIILETKNITPEVPLEKEDIEDLKFEFEEFLERWSFELIDMKVVIE